MSSCFGRVVMFFPSVWGTNNAVAARGDVSRCVSQLRPHWKRPPMTITRQVSIKQVRSFSLSANYMEEAAVTSAPIIMFLLIFSWLTGQSEVGKADGFVYPATVWTITVWPLHCLRCTHRGRVSLSLCKRHRTCCFLCTKVDGGP